MDRHFKWIGVDEVKPRYGNVEYGMNGKWAPRERLRQVGQIDTTPWVSLYGRCLIVLSAVGLCFPLRYIIA